MASRSALIARSVQDSAIEHDFEATARCLLPRATHCDRRTGIGQPCRVIHHGRCDHTHVNDVDAGHADTRLQCGRQRHAGQAGIAPHHHRARAKRVRTCTDGYSQGVRKARVDLAGCLPADLTSFEDGVRNAGAVPVE